MYVEKKEAGKKIKLPFFIFYVPEMSCLHENFKTTGYAVFTTLSGCELSARKFKNNQICCIPNYFQV